MEIDINPSIGRPKAYSYVRFSTPEQAKGDSRRRQVAMAQDYASRHGLELDESLTFHDVGVSAFRGQNANEGRLGYFLEAVDTGLVPRDSFLLVENLDRISRQTARRAARTLEDIVDRGVTVVTLDDGKEYSSAALDTDALALIMAVLHFARANDESATKARRLRAVWDVKRSRSGEVPMTAAIPAWLTLNRVSQKIEIIPDRAATVKAIFEQAVAGVGQHRIAAILNKAKVKPWGRGAFWGRSYVAKILTNPAVIGQFTPHVMDYAEGRKTKRPLDTLNGYYPAVVEPEVYAEVQAIRASGAAARGRHAAQPVCNVLAALAKCSVCGRTMTRTVKGKRSQPSFVCVTAKAGAGCQYRSVRYAWVVLAIIERLPALLGDIPAGDTDVGLEGQIRGAEAWADELREDGQALLDPDTDAPAGGRGRALAKVEASLRDAEALVPELLQRREASSGPLVAVRVAGLLEALSGDPQDAARINLAMRRPSGARHPLASGSHPIVAQIGHSGHAYKEDFSGSKVQ